MLQRVVRALQLEMTHAAYERLARRPLRAFQGRPPSVLLARFVDGFAAQSSASLGVLGAFFDAPLTVAGLVVLFFHSPLLALLTTGAAVLAAVLLRASTPRMV